MSDNILTVKQLNFYVRSILENDNHLLNVTVTGEISNFKNHYASGHWYFTLKDNDATIRCVMFKANTKFVKFDVSDGLQVVIRGRVTLYERDGQYQFYAEEMNVAGLGDITLQYEQIKERLAKEGLFDQNTKRPIPKFPKSIAVVTSQTGAAVRDIFNVLSRRWPICDAKLFSVSVQGELAVSEMINSLEEIYSLSSFDLIIIGRGGGSIEDLWAFNDEKLARKIYESPIPVISGVGHETDFTICDFVSDLRAPTPSAAAELAVPDINEVNNKFDIYLHTLKKNLIASYKYNKERLEKLANSTYFKNPSDSIINQRYQMLDELYIKINDNIDSIFKSKESDLSQMAYSLDILSPLKTMARGYAAISSKNKPVNSINDVKVGDRLQLNISDGQINCLVESLKHK